MNDGVDITQLLIERGHLFEMHITDPKIKPCQLRCIFRISKVSRQMVYDIFLGGFEIRIYNNHMITINHGFETKIFDIFFIIYIL